jgi:hypothetical protein
MQNKKSRWLISLWLLLSALLTVVLYVASQSVVEKAVAQSMRQHLLLTLDEALFGTTPNRGNDEEGLQRVGQQLNADLTKFVGARWYSPLRNCDVQLERVDNVDIDDQTRSAQAWERTLRFQLLRNQLERDVEIGLSCARNGWVAAGISGFLGLLFVAIGYAFPPPLSRTHRQWINYLLERGYTGAQAFDLVREYAAPELILNASQQAALEQLHDSENCNFAQALEVAIDPRVAALDQAAVDWLVLGLRREPGNLDGALALARADDTVVIDLPAMSLAIRGLLVPTSGTPLFYYAWYAKSRLAGEGWITNPASNRPDRAAGEELIQLMNRFDGHARAINDLERAGLKARTLDQNRSKIKDEIVAALGEQLADTYLFEASKHPDGVHTRYRLRMQGRQIRIVDAA